MGFIPPHIHKPLLLLHIMGQIKMCNICLSTVSCFSKFTVRAFKVKALFTSAQKKSSLYLLCLIVPFFVWNGGKSHLKHTQYIALFKILCNMPAIWVQYCTLKHFNQRHFLLFVNINDYLYFIPFHLNIISDVIFHSEIKNFLCNRVSYLNVFNAATIQIFYYITGS